MKEIKISPLIVDSIGRFFRSSRDALERSKHAQENNSEQDPTGINVLINHQAEAQASIESIVFSFLTIEATINYFFFVEMRNRQLKTFDRWLQQKWKRSMSINDRFIILVNQYTMANTDDFQYLMTLLSEFITFRNRIVHAMPEEYNALVEETVDESDILYYDVEPLQRQALFSCSGLSGELGRISCADAKRGFEIMLLVVCFLDEQFVGEFVFPWGKDEQQFMSTKDIIASLPFRYYPKLLTDQFIPEFIKEMKKAQQNHPADPE